MRDNKMLRSGEIGAIIVPIIAFILLSLALAPLQPSFAIPQGAQITSTSVENATARAADSHTAQGGSFTTMLLNVTSQTSKWKAYVGNVSGKITLDNSQNKTIYDWAVSTITGEVFVSRNSSIVFSSLACADSGNITSEQNYLGINSTSDDSLNKTFKSKIHRQFTIGGTGLIANSTCYSIATFINDSSQASSEAASFQEMLMSDGLNVVYVSLFEGKKQGFDTNPYDFQIIVPDDPLSTSTTYFFFAELS
jgi:hypothetical protein